MDETTAAVAAACLFHGMGDPSRVAILQHLLLGEHKVVELTAHLGLAQSTVSKHLACLRDCGLVTLRTEGRASWFALADPARLSAVLEDADAFLAASGMLLSLRDHRDHDQLTAEEL